MKAIIDTSPLISFAVLDQLDLVDKLFNEIIIPSAVSREIRMSKNKKEYNKISIGRW
jgi:predicted nucleic acid-binding protein